MLHQFLLTLWGEGRTVCLLNFVELIGQEGGLLLGIAGVGWIGLVVFTLRTEVDPGVLPPGLGRHSTTGLLGIHYRVRPPCILLSARAKSNSLFSVAKVVVDRPEDIIVRVRRARCLFRKRGGGWETSALIEV